MRTTLRTIGALAAAAAVLASAALAAPAPGASASGPAAQTPQTRYAYLPYVARSQSNQPAYPPAGSSGMSYVNFYRATAGLPPLAEVAAWSGGDAAHARYSTKNDYLSHTEDPGNPWYTPEGAAAAGASNQIGSHDVAATDEWAIAVWMGAPFHAVGILDPALQQSGYGSYREADSGLQMSAGLDVIRGLGSIPPTVTLPAKWPGNGMSVPITDHWGETPNPLTSCPGYTAPSGLPVLLIFGGNRAAPVLGAHSFLDRGTSLEHCVFDGSTYTNPDSLWESTGRNILSSRNAIVLIPRLPLSPAGRYTVSITADGMAYNWSFTVTASAAGASYAGDATEAVTHGLVAPPVARP